MFNLKCDVKYSNNLSKIAQDLNKNKNLKAYAGILQKNNNREAEETGKTTKTNAEIGYLHEFGSQGGFIPQRSFLRMPIQHKKKLLKEQIAIFSKNLITNKEFSIPKLLTHIGYVAKNIILDAFDTGGFGKWKALSPVSLMLRKLFKNKDHSEILKVELQLLRSIDFELKK